MSKGSYLQKYQVNSPQPQFKPLVQVDPSLLNTNRMPLQNPRPGDYLLNKTASTEGIASKKSLELKKRYLLGEHSNGNKIQKSGSTSVLDSKIRSFQSNISECQKLLNPGNDISASMKTFLDRTKLGENARNDLMRSTTSSILNDLKVEITIQKASSTASTDNEKENVYVNSKNELNKGLEYSEAVNTTLLASISKKAPSTPINNIDITETIDLITSDKQVPISIIDLTKVDIPPKMMDSNLGFIKSMNVDNDHNTVLSLPDKNDLLLVADSNKVIDLTIDSPTKNREVVAKDTKPDVSKDVNECIPDILGHIDNDKEEMRTSNPKNEEHRNLLYNSCDEEKGDSPEKMRDEQCDNGTFQIRVPNIPWNKRKTENISSNTGSSSSNSSSMEDIEHYLLESTTSPDTQTGAVNAHQVPRVEIHDSTGTLMQIDSLMIIDGKYVGDPEDLKFIDVPEGVMVPEIAAVKTSEVEDDIELEVEPVTATPEPAECTVIEADEQAVPSPLPEKESPTTRLFTLKFDTKNENKIESLKNLPLIVEQMIEHEKAVKPISLNLSKSKTSGMEATTTPTGIVRTPLSSPIDNDKTPTADLISKCSDSETEATGTAQVLTETELSDWTADDCISENFIEMEFVSNSNKGTIKRNKKSKKKLYSAKLASTNEMGKELKKAAPVAEFEGILKTIDIDDIEFMDTGSEGSCAEAYSATNTALLRNRGYIEFIEMTPKKLSINQIKKNSLYSDTGKYECVTTKRDEKLGIDYIEQGAYIMQNEEKDHELKTPVNEGPHITEKAQSHVSLFMPQSLTDSSALNDIDEDSLCIVSPNSQIQLSSVASNAKTTEESDALTVVTSQPDTSSPKLNYGPKGVNNEGQGSETGGGSTPSSSDKNPKSSLSTCTPTSMSVATPSKVTPCQLSQELERVNTIEPCGPTEELSYEEYVRALQQKIAQISTARDSFDIRKQRRKSSKGDTPAVVWNSLNTQSVIEPTSPKLKLNSDENMVTSTEVTQIHKVPEIPTLTRKLEEITKERTKQKDLIHDLVMDKLQSKKQLNAEKRLNRSRQRSLLTGSGCSGLSPTPKIGPTTTTNDTNCTNQAHYHISTAATEANERTQAHKTLPDNSTTSSENNSLQKLPVFVSAYGAKSVSTPSRFTNYKQHPFTTHADSEELETFACYKPTKNTSVNYALARPTQCQASGDDSIQSIPHPFTTSKVSMNRSPECTEVVTKSESISKSTENLRSEARARAKLKSNYELGLSPEEKMQLLRERLQYEHSNAKCKKTSEFNLKESPEQMVFAETSGRSQQQRRMNSSKSVNDLMYILNQQIDSTDNSQTKERVILADCTSDPNLLLSSNSAQKSIKKHKSKSLRRQKEPERRKSLIQSLSNFFHKNASSSTSGQNTKDKKDQCETKTADDNFVRSERPCTSSSSTTTSNSIDGVLSRFRISPRSKEKSKSCFDLRNFGFGAIIIQGKDIDSFCPNNANATSTSKPARYKRSTSQDFILNNNNNGRNSDYNTSSSNEHNKAFLKSTVSTTGSATAEQAMNVPSPSSQLFTHKSYKNPYSCSDFVGTVDHQLPPPIPPPPLNYQRSDDESYATENRDQKRQRAISKAVRQAELKRLRIAQEIQREQEEIEVQLKELEARGVLIEKALRGEGQSVDGNLDITGDKIGASDEKLLKDLLEIWRNITQLKKRDEELGIRQRELQLEHRHAQLKEELNLRLSCNKLEKSSADVAAEGAILNEMLEIVAKRAALRPTTSNLDLASVTTSDVGAGSGGFDESKKKAATDGVMLVTTSRRQSQHKFNKAGGDNDDDESHI